MPLTRRHFMQVAATLGASLAWGGAGCQSGTKTWRERRDLYPEGVASGDPDANSVILWTRRPFEEGDRHVLTVEVAEDEAFHRTIAHAAAPVSAASDWTTRVLVAGLEPARVYWYRFTDADGNGSRVGRTLEVRADPEHLDPGLTRKPWPAGSFANLGGRDHASAWTERNEIFDLVRDAKITGFAIVSGDRHSFWAGYASAQLPPGTFEPVGLSFVGASLSSPGAMESYEHRLPEDLPLRPLYLADRADGGAPEWTFNMLLKHGVRSCLEYAKSFDRERARALSNPALSPHVAFVDMGGHGYATVRLSGDEMRTEFVCIPRPITRSAQPDGGPLRYRVAHSAKLWSPGERPQLTQQVLEGDPGLGI